MALTTLDVYKQLPKTNCKDCGLPTCMAFAMQVASKQKALTDCPHVSDETKSELSDVSTPPMRLVTIGTGDRSFTCGQETVMFRHEEKFHHPCGIAIRIPGSLPSDKALAVVEQINTLSFERVGEKLGVSLCAIDTENAQDPVGRVRTLSEKSSLPVVVMGSEAGVLKESVKSIRHLKPLIYGTGRMSSDDLIAIASDTGCPVVLEGRDPDDFSRLTQAAKEKDVVDVVLGFNGNDPKQTLFQLTLTRRAALLKNFRPLGFPPLVNLTGIPADMVGLYGNLFSVKYAAMVILDVRDAWELVPILTSIQDVFTNPQVPNTVDPKLYEIGSVGENSPVLFTTNFALTYFSVAGEVERSRIPSYISVVETEGMGVLNAYAGDKISVAKVVKSLEEQGVADKVKHRKLIIPGLLPVFRAEIQDTSPWKDVIIGPKNAREIPAFLNKNWV